MKTTKNNPLFRDDIGMKQILSVTFGIVASLLVFSVAYGEFSGIHALLILSPLALSALFAIGSIRSSGICRILLTLYAAAVTSTE